ncbi:MAG: 16S rRNA (uracil(1498)-N(3))-methyltransferase [Halomonadaceae bacterium]|nr:MAG: 16S rRNA (uracil(1498)-N(3))-methyltransferase [Halomonadaceae bacterium]
MRIPRIYVDQPLENHASLTLEGDAAHYLGRVLRLGKDQPLILFNGDGKDYPGQITQTSKTRLGVGLGEGATVGTESPLPVTLAQVISRGDRMDYVIQKSVEMGVTAIQPLTSERCEVRLNPQREDKRLRHWQQVAVSAAEQCGRAVVPVVAPLRALADWLPSAPGEGLRLVLHHRSHCPLGGMARPEAVTLLIGPEGGLSDQEIVAAREQQFQPCTLGPRVMRTETAPVAAVAVIQWLWGDLQPGPNSSD